MYDLIYRDKIKQTLLELGFYPAIVKSALENAPAVDAVPVVRCEDCKHLLRDSSIRRYHTCMRCRMPQRVGLNDFCSFGEMENAKG